MKVAKVLLRWYKSFNVNYAGYFNERRAHVEPRPWNRIGVKSDDFPFIEIPLADDITTIVGANESGKSHLLSAISKVLSGEGIPEASGKKSDYSRTDLCHYTSPRSKNAEDWPHIGLQFQALSDKDLDDIAKAVGNQSLATTATETTRLTLILAPDNKGTLGHLFIDNGNPVPLDADKLSKVRACLPKVQFIKSELAISDQVPISSLLSAYGGGNAKAVFDYNAAQNIASLIHALTLGGDNPQLPADFGKELQTWQKTLAGARLDSDHGAELEALLFKDVMGITAETLRFVAGLPLDDRTHADSLTAKWNREIDERLNLSHYWQQDDSFAMKVNYKQGILYFEITDKTGATYTFRERSSGLRFFLSYYIQAKALELTSRGQNAIILMDEPDSFLSILGQRNLLAVFESLVRAESSGQTCQLVYTTHSPFLINKNYPHRIRLVKKGDAEEGTQLGDQAMLRRYEPIRSALGIDCAQTLFMGRTNLVVEGPTDQYLFAELIRHFIRPDNVSDLLDLNSLVMVSAESAPSVEKLLSASQWGDEPVPATVVFLDSDAEGDKTKAKITGQNLKPSQVTEPDEKRGGNKRLIDDQFVLQIGTVLKEANGQKIVTTEDILPPKLFAQAIENYVAKWHPEKDTATIDKLKQAMAQADFFSGGLVAGASKVFDDFIHDAPKLYDKMGVLQEVVHLLDKGGNFDRDVLENRLKTFCHEVRRTISACQQAARRSSGKQSIKRLINDFFKTNKESSSVFDIQLLLERLQRDCKLLGKDGELLDAGLGRLLEEVAKARASEQHHFKEAIWNRWKGVIHEIYKNPLSVKIGVGDNGPQLDGAEPKNEPSIQSPQSDAKATGGVAV